MCNDFIVLGDSIMKGVTFNSELKKYKLCPNAKFDFLNNFQVINKSKMGATINYALKRIDENKELFKNSYVLVSYGGNDCEYNWKEISCEPKSEHICAVEPNRFIKLYSDCISALKGLNAKVVLTNLIPIDADKYVNWISNGLNKENIINWLGDASTLYRWHEYYSNLTSEVANKNNCPLIDIRTPFLSTQAHNYKNSMCLDGIHPNNDGYIVIQNTIKNNLQNLL